MNPEITVYYHADCLDGFGAAFAAWRRFGAAARYLPLHYDQPWRHEDVDGRRVYVIDVCFPRPVMQTIARIAESVWLIDHHASARDQWADCLETGPDGVERYEAGRLHVYFDMRRSGARLGWEHFHPGVPLPELLAAVEDQDLWRFALPDARALCRALRLRAFEFVAWDALVRAVEEGGEGRAGLVAEGAAVERFMHLEVDRLSQGNQVGHARLPAEPVDPLQAGRHGVPLIVEGEVAWRAVPGLAANANAMFSSELGHLLAEASGTFGLVWYMDGSGIVKASLRASGKVNVAQLAERFGGGGHPNAAGFRMPAARFMKLVLGRED